jgi:ABC-type dipeptide/oligopeptide/nickel transport system ATPase subunit
MTEEVLNILNEDYNQGSTYSLVGLSNVGKTALLLNIAVKLSLRGKKILFLTDESIPLTYKKLHNLMGSFANGEIIVSDSLSNINELDNMFKALKFDLLIVDDTMMSEYSYGVFSTMSKEHNCSVIFTYNARKNIITSTNIFGRSIKYLQQSDVVMQLEKLSLTETLLTKIYYVLLFWNKKPNLSLSIIKNRFGKESTTNFFLDLNLNKK